MKKNIAGQPNVTFSHASSGVRKARPTNSADVYTAMQVARSRSPNQVVAMRLLIRKLGTSNNPTVIRRMISMTRPVESPRHSVAIDQKKMASG